ncbi:Sec-independent protein translocase subunit TatA/TatB [Pseudacidobacterium ailaaui]|jgi:sec-independent protein translocase protein TatB|uniref:Sec-independent protein translocase subunit TatA/TatB n=1 Tax=Pseudacidobacterium ailaaui TaxID=1382359 RepID=UPI000679BDA5|nr:twin-arginine translocase TatA/TatE family subunit [Pseudacidobacterium ailaaui]MBX6360329.1 twin-arginine translocase TatA/TatE family subunit [Pseudacidobacterium ailaaui]MDI3254481.1 twin-arginine translocase TatA/TatE family subunit [Bacillota bacterium]
MHFGDSIFIFLLALVLFGPKKLPEIGRQIGKLLAEFRRASNEFKMQIDEELRAMEHEERQKQLEKAAEEARKKQLPEEQEKTLTILPPSSGVTVTAESPYVNMPKSEIAAEYLEALAKEEQTQQAAALNGDNPQTSQESEQAPIHHG